MTTFTLVLAPQSYTLSKVLNDQVFQSITGAITASGRTGNRYSLSMSWIRPRAEYMGLLGFIGQLDGKMHRLKVPASKFGYVKQGAGGGTPLVYGSHLAGTNTLNLKGLPVATTGILQPGDPITIGNQFCIATSILSSTGSPNTRGSCTIWPELHKNYSDGAAVDYATPSGIFILMSEGNFGMDFAGFGTLSVDLMQDVLA